MPNYFYYDGINLLVKYFYSGVKTWHFKYQDGREVTQFNNGKTETKFPDGTVVIDEANGDSIILLPNGQKEEHTSQYKVNELCIRLIRIWGTLLVNLLANFRMIKAGYIWF